MSGKKWSQISEGLLSLRFHTSIDTLTVSKWFTIHKDGNLTRLYKFKYFWMAVMALSCLLILVNSFIGISLLILFYILSKFDAIMANKAWELVYNEFIKRVGHSKEYLDYVNLIKGLAILKAEWIVEPSPVKKTNIKLKENELLAKAAKKEEDYMQIVAAVSKRQGFRVNPNKVTVAEFYAYIKGEQ